MSQRVWLRMPFDILVCRCEKDSTGYLQSIPKGHDEGFQL